VAIAEQMAPAKGGADNPVEKSGRRRSSTHRWVLAGVLLTFFVVWEVVSRVGLVDATFISRPTAIIAAIPDMAGDERAREAIVTTGSAIAWAVLYGIIAGVCLGYVLGSVRLLRDAFYGPIVFMMSIPKSIFIPIFLVIFGINSQTSIYYGAFSSFIYVIVNVVGGLDLIEERHLMVARAYGASWWHRLVHIVFPASLPGVFTGIWYGLKNALQGVLIFELFISVGGLGALIQHYTNNLETDRVFAVVLGVSILAILVGEGWSALERRLSRWRPSSTIMADTR
jgi:ABC-type nitrate/sulfonate/bicarbonate transport system permease component